MQLRTVFRARLDRVREQQVLMAQRVSNMVAEASRALLQADLELAERCITSDQEVNELQTATDDNVVQLMTLEAPVATDFRVLVAALRATSDLERMGDLAAHVAVVARRRYPDCAVPDPLVPTVAELGSRAQSIGEKAGLLLASHDLELVSRIRDEDKEINRLHQSLFGVLLDPQQALAPEQIIDTALFGRYYERFGDHAVHVADHVEFLVTGRYADESRRLR